MQLTVKKKTDNFMIFVTSADVLNPLLSDNY